jgi:protein-tyrosine phosphatase
MPTDIFWIRAASRGRLAVMPRPRGGDWLEDEILHLKQSGIGVLVSMLTPEEESLLELEDEAALARRHGLEFHSHPIPDRDVPGSAREMWALAGSLAEQFREGRQIAVHCRMGIGRSPLLLACILVRSGLRPEDAWEAIGDARGCVVPDTLEQRNWLSRTAPGR